MNILLEFQRIIKQEVSVLTVRWDKVHIYLHSKISCKARLPCTTAHSWLVDVIGETHRNLSARWLRNSNIYIQMFGLSGARLNAHLASNRQYIFVYMSYSLTFITFSLFMTSNVHFRPFSYSYSNTMSFPSSPPPPLFFPFSFFLLLPPPPPPPPLLFSPFLPSSVFC